MSTLNYTFDPAAIELVGGVARLILPQTSGTILVNEVNSVKQFVSLVEDVNKTGSDTIQYQFLVNGSLVYYNAGWVSSNGSFAQSNSVATINANAGSLISGSNKTLQVQAILKGSGTTSPELNSLTVNFKYGPIFTPAADNCVVYCYLEDILGADLDPTTSLAVLYAVNERAFMNNGYVVARYTKSSTFATTTNGFRASLELQNTASSNQKIRFFIAYSKSADLGRMETIPFNPCVIPNQTTADLTVISSVDQDQLI